MRYLGNTPFKIPDRLLTVALMERVSSFGPDPRARVSVSGFQNLQLCLANRLSNMSTLADFTCVEMTSAFKDRRASDSWNAFL